MFRLYKSIERGAVNRSVQQSIGMKIIATFKLGMDEKKWKAVNLAEWQRFLTIDHGLFGSLEQALEFERLLSLHSLEGTAKGLGGYMFNESMNQSVPLLKKKFVEKELVSLDTQMRQLINLSRFLRETGKLDYKKLVKIGDKTAKGIIATTLFPGIKKILEKEKKLMEKFDAAVELIRKHDGKTGEELKAEGK